MRTVILSDYEELSIKAAQQVKEELQKKPDAVLALAAGRTTGGLYGELSRMCRAGELSFKSVKIFAVAEYEDDAGINSCRRVLENSMINNIDVKKENCFFPSRENSAWYDDNIVAAGGIDLAVLGIGVNAHIGYNEPATPFESYTHIQKLSDAVKRQNAEVFKGTGKVPEYAVTMGIKTIVSARKIIVLASGEEKADAVFRMIYGRTESYTPASFLQIPAEVTAYIDKAAAWRL